MSGSPSGLVPRTNNSSLGLGATGGPRGFAAGVTQVLVNFLVNYSKGNIEQLRKDIAGVNAATALNNQRQQAYLQKQVALEQSLRQVQLARLDAAVKGGAVGKAALDLLNKQLAYQKAGGTLDAQRTAELRLYLATLERNGILSQQQVGYLQNEFRLTQALKQAQLGVNDAKQRGLALTRQQSALQQAQTFATQGASRIGSLALGLIGGTIGGAITSGLLLGPLQGLLDSVAKSAERVIDPAKGAADALSAVSEAIDDLSQGGDLSTLEAATELLKQLRINQNQAAALTSAPDLESAQKYLDLQRQTTDYLNGHRQLWNQIGSEIVFNRSTLELENQAIERGSLFAEQTYESFRFLRDMGTLPIVDQFLSLVGQPTLSQFLGIDQGTIDSANREAAALGDVAEQARIAADYISDLNQQSLNVAIEGLFDSQIGTAEGHLDRFIQRTKDAAQAQIGIINNFYDIAIERIGFDADKRIAALQKQLSDLEVQPSARTRELEKQLDALNDAGPSKRTRELANAIEALNTAQDKARYKAQLADIAEQKQQLLLKQRLALTDEQINLDEYSGKDRLVAIDALLERMREQNERQATFNKLLDIQYQISQGVRRQQGETIQEFIERRAQYYRGLLQQAAELRQKGPEADLQAERERVSDSVALKELEEKRRKVIEDRAREQHLDSLREQLKASQERDRKELESRRQSLQDQLDASKKADQARLDAEREGIRDRIAAIKEETERKITLLNLHRDNAIAAEERQRDAAIRLAQQITEATTRQLQARAEQAKQWTNYANIQALNAAVNGVQSMAQLQALSGQISGLSWTMNYLQQTGAYLGLDPSARTQLLRSYTSLIRDYGNKVQSLYKSAQPPKPPSFGIPGKGGGGGYAEGGIFRLGNYNTPVSGDIRWGDGNGDEIGMRMGDMGVVLSNKVVQALRDNGGAGAQALIGTMNIGGGEDPYRARAAWRKEVRDLVRSELN